MMMPHRSGEAVIPRRELLENAGLLLAGAGLSFLLFSRGGEGVHAAVFILFAVVTLAVICLGLVLSVTRCVPLVAVGSAVSSELVYLLAVFIPAARHPGPVDPIIFVAVPVILFGAAPLVLAGTAAFVRLGLSLGDVRRRRGFRRTVRGMAPSQVRKAMGGRPDLRRRGVWGYACQLPAGMPEHARGTAREAEKPPPPQRSAGAKPGRKRRVFLVFLFKNGELARKRIAALPRAPGPSHSSIRSAGG